MNNPNPFKQGSPGSTHHATGPMPQPQSSWISSGGVSDRSP
jgi:hypothetical protein